MTTAIDLGPLLRLAFHTSDVTDATRAIEEARARFSEVAKLDGFSFEVVVPSAVDGDWVLDRVIRPLVYFCESRGAPPPACPGVFVSLFVGSRVHCVVGAEVLAWASRELGVSIPELHARYGLEERDTALR
jgi:hypothetical protein